MANVNNINAIAEYVGEVLSPDFTSDIRSMARYSDWPVSAAYDLEVAYTDGNLEVQYSEEMSGSIDNLEYGDINSLPKAVIRPFIYRAQPQIGKAYEMHALDMLMVEGGFI